MDLSDPLNVAALNEQCRAWAAPDETIYPIAIEQVVLADDALERLPDLLAARTRGTVALITDSTPMLRDGADLKARVVSLLEPVVENLVPITLADPFHADLPTAEALAGRLHDVDAVVSVGSGSVTDTVKYARHLLIPERGRVPFLAAPTAASVTAYTSALAVLLVDGAKRTLPAEPPDLVVCDLPTLTDAPPRMTQAGFGDVLARSVSYGDWFLAARLGMCEGFSRVPARLLEESEQDMLAAAAEVGRGEASGVATVTRAVLLGGIAMSLVNQTAPLSGWEHVISHFLDMTAAHDRRTPALHGEQVGVGTLVAARAYETAWPELDLERLRWQPSEAEEQQVRERVAKLFRAYDRSGRMAAEIDRDLSRKLALWREGAAARRRFLRDAAEGDIDAFLRENVRSPDRIADALAAAGAPLRFEELSEKVPRASALAAVRYGHLIRARFTLGDLLELCGHLTERHAAAYLDAG